MVKLSGCSVSSSNTRVEKKVSDEDMASKRAGILQLNGVQILAMTGVNKTSTKGLQSRLQHKGVYTHIGMHMCKNRCVSGGADAQV